MHNYKNIGLILGIAIFVIMLCLPHPQSLSPEAWKVAAVAILMAIWWSTEAIPVFITSLLPIALFPLLNIAPTKDVTSPYAHPVIFLLLGGFIIASTLERWNLHKRLALMILTKAGNNQNHIIAGFMIACALLSMWISNTATTIMMLPIAISLAAFFSNGKDNQFSICLILAIAYSSSIGGMGTLIGTPPNALFAAYMSEHYNMDIGFAKWMLIGIPVVIVLIPLSWYVMTRFIFKLNKQSNNDSGDLIQQQLTELGNWSKAEKRTIIVFFVVALCWMTRPLLQNIDALSQLSDTKIAIIGAIVLFLIPSGKKDERLLDWPTASKIPWGVLLLFGGGMSLAKMVNKTGLATWLGENLSFFTSFHLLLFILLLVAFVVFLTELTSNTATTATLLPVMAGIASASNFDPLLLCIPMTLAASCAFMLPVATAPNAIIFASGKVTIMNMIKTGFYLNIVAMFAISLLVYFLLQVITL